MNTNYGERPGLVVEGRPITMDAEQEREDRRAIELSLLVPQPEIPGTILPLVQSAVAVRAYAELDATRRAHAAALDSIGNAAEEILVARKMIDAERAAHAATLEALEAVCDSEGGVQSLAEARAILASTAQRGAK